MNDINQGYLGDCYFLSSCAEVADQNASDISSMFTNNGNGTYGVRFYVNGVAEYVTVNTALADGGTEFNYGTDIWASLAEKAWAQFQAVGLDTGNPQQMTAIPTVPSAMAATPPRAGSPDRRLPSSANSIRTAQAGTNTRTIPR